MPLVERKSADDLEISLEAQQWNDACLCVELMKLTAPNIYPKIWIKVSNDQVLDDWLSYAYEALGQENFRILPHGIDAAGMQGGLDITQTLTSGKQVMADGLLDQAKSKVLVVTLNPTLEPEVQNLLIAAIDQSTFGVIVIDRSEPDQEAPFALQERMMFHLDLRAVSIRHPKALSQISLLPSERAFYSDQDLEEICHLALGFGLHSMRPAMQAAQVALAHARAMGRAVIAKDDVAAGLRLSLINRAQAFPDLTQDEPEQESTTPESAPDPHEEPNPENQPENNSEPSDENEPKQQSALPDDLDILAEKAQLPPEILRLLQMQNKAIAKSSNLGKNGVKNYSFKRGRPVASIKRKLSSRNRADLIATLRTAAPWQRIRDQTNRIKRKVYIQPGDFHVKRFHQQSETTTIFVVDASGSTALNRLGEAKGAIEMLLSESYARRDYVSLIAAKGMKAEVLLPTTRSLVRAKRHLTGLRGGGGTPLADGLRLAATVYKEEAKRGRQASIVIVTDGSANVDLAGKGGRAKAGEDVAQMARLIKTLNAPAIIVDVNRLPNKRVDELAQAMSGTYIPMPFVSAQNISTAIRNNQSA